jgi:putative FmdB family regulatory protein
MPIYDYKCRECGRVSEVLQRSLEGEAIKCPHCGSEDVEKLMSASYMVRMGRDGGGTTCCGSTERCDAPPCSTGDVCHRD